MVKPKFEDKKIFRYKVSSSGKIIRVPGSYGTSSHFSQRVLTTEEEGKTARKRAKSVRKIQFLAHYRLSHLKDRIIYTTAPGPNIRPKEVYTAKEALGIFSGQDFRRARVVGWIEEQKMRKKRRK